jgi:hypothetical protein
MGHFKLFEQFNESLHAAVGRKQVKIVIEGDDVKDSQDKILKAVARVDPDNTLKFYDATGKIVGNVTKVRMSSIERDIKSISKNITVREKE